MHVIQLLCLVGTLHNSELTRKKCSKFITSQLYIIVYDCTYNHYTDIFLCLQCSTKDFQGDFVISQNLNTNAYENPTTYAVVELFL